MTGAITSASTAAAHATVEAGEPHLLTLVLDSAALAAANFRFVRFGAMRCRDDDRALPVRRPTPSSA